MYTEHQVDYPILTYTINNQPPYQPGEGVVGIDWDEVALKVLSTLVGYQVGTDIPVLTEFPEFKPRKHEKTLIFRHYNVNPCAWTSLLLPYGGLYAWSFITNYLWYDQWYVGV